MRRNEHSKIEFMVLRKEKYESVKVRMLDFKRADNPFSEIIH